MSAALACGRVGHEVVLLEEGSEVCTYFEIQKRILIGVKRPKRLEQEFRWRQTCSAC